MTETVELPTQEQRDRAADNMQKFGVQFDSFMDAFLKGRITREQFKETMAAYQTAAAAREDRAKQKSVTDGMTGLLNKKGFDERYKEHVERIKRGGESAVALIIDLNGLKEINDTKGHEAGNQQIRYTSQILKENTRALDSAAFVSRPGGDEFTVVLSNMNQKGAESWWKRINPKLEEKEIKLSIGSSDIDPNNPGESLDLADAAMYAAKKLKGDRKSHYMQMRFENGIANPVEVPPPARSIK